MSHEVATVSIPVIVVPAVEERIVEKLFLVDRVRLSRPASAGQADEKIRLRSQRMVVEREESSGETSTHHQE